MKTGTGLAEYALSQLGRPYWWGCFGQRADAALYARKKKQYPAYYTATDFSSQYGQKVHDCVGLIKGYLWCGSPDGSPKYKAAQDVAVEGLYRTCSRRGGISALPETLGVCVFMRDMGHVGVYIGNGEVVEAMGHAYGVVKTKLAGRAGPTGGGYRTGYLTRKFERCWVNMAKRGRLTSTTTCGNPAYMAGQNWTLQNNYLIIKK